LISAKTIGRPIAPLPIINPAAPVTSRHFAALFASVMSPLAITGISTRSTTLAMVVQSAFPEYPWRKVRP
jgi:hypothetical protein